jgi:regulator of sigma E protease
MLTSIVAAIVILGILIVVHETGHFMMAKRCGVRVLRFSIGYPPKIWSIRRGETEYTLSATPLGGYVRMLGDEIGEEPGPGDAETLLKETASDLLAAVKSRATEAVDPDRELVSISKRLGSATDGQRVPAAFDALARDLRADPERSASDSQALAAFGRPLTPLEARVVAEIGQRGSVQEAISVVAEARPRELAETLTARSFPTQSVGKRILIVVAGPLANFVFAPIALAIVLMYGVPRLLPVLGEVKQGMPASTAGLKTGDRVLAIDGAPVATWNNLSDTVRASDGRPLRIEFERKDAQGLRHQIVMLKPAREHSGPVAGGNWVIGVLPRGDSLVQRLGPLSAGKQAVVETGRITVMLVSGIAEIIRGTTPIREAMGGPIMIAQLAGQQAHQGFASVALFTVMLSIQLTIINLIPVPMLDGGHLAFFLLECLRGKPIAVRHREVAQRVGLVVLVALMAFVIFNDISRIVQG